MENASFFTQLFKKYLNDQCSPEEIDQLMELLQRDEYKLIAHDLIERQVSQKMEVHQVDFDLNERLESRLTRILEENAREIQIPRRTILIRLTRQIAAVAAVLVIAVAGWLYIKPTPSKPLAESQVSNVTPPSVSYIRNVTLPDGSTIILHANSKLDLLSDFNGRTREVNLEGEAYFDIVHNAGKPFIIHTGKVKTTVLGTSFNIKSDKEHVIVSVTRGKVRVEEGSKLLAILTPDQQVKYDVPNASSSLQVVDADSIVKDWTKEDLIFNGLTLEEIGEHLNKRFGVNLVFNKESLKKCQVRASFSGTENIDQILSVLCGIRNGTYTKLQNGTILFDGEGCD